MTKQFQHWLDHSQPAVGAAFRHKKILWGYGLRTDAKGEPPTCHAIRPPRSWLELPAVMR